MTTTYYKKVGRRYIPAVIEFDREVMQVGAFRLTYAYSEGGRMYRYDVTPDTAGFHAAAMIAVNAMESAIVEAAKASPESSKQYTPGQLKTIEEFRDKMGGMFPQWWDYLSAREIAQAGVDAVAGYRP